MLKECILIKKKSGKEKVKEEKNVPAGTKRGAKTSPQGRKL